MEVYGIKPIDSSTVYGSTQLQEQTEHSAKHMDDRRSQGVAENSQGKKREPDLKMLGEVTDEMNSIVETLNTNIKFKLHEKTQNLMVQVVNVKNGEVLKEFPPHELLDVMAKIKEFVGALIDKKI